MIGPKHNLCVGITTFNAEMLYLSIPALGRIRRKFLLVIYNDNPGVTISRRQIHDMGYRGDMLIINGEENIGLFRARLEIIRAVGALRNRPQWIMFADDDDIVTNLDMPDNIPVDNYAIIQNTLVIKRRMLDVMRAMNNPDDLVADGENVVLTPQGASVLGRLYRTDVLVKFADCIRNVMDALTTDMNRLSYLPPVDNIMCSLINIFVDAYYPNSMPIFMNRVNYISIKLDSAPHKYGCLVRPARNAADMYAKVMAQCNAEFAEYIASAAPAGQN